MQVTTCVLLTLHLNDECIAHSGTHVLRASLYVVRKSQTILQTMYARKNVRKRIRAHYSDESVDCRQHALMH